MALGVSLDTSLSTLASRSSSSWRAFSAATSLCCFVPFMPLVKTTAHTGCNQRAPQRYTCRQPPAPLPHALRQHPRPAQLRIAPRMYAQLEVDQRLPQRLIQRLTSGHTVRSLPLSYSVPVTHSIPFCPSTHQTHRLPPNSARTLLSARERCAFTVPSLNPVASAISLNSCSSTYRSRKTVR